MQRTKQVQVFSPGGRGTVQTDWREVEFIAGVTFGATADSDELLFLLLSRMLAGQSTPEPDGMTFIGAPRHYNHAGGIARRFEARLKGEDSDAVTRLMIVTLTGPPTGRSFIIHLLTRLLALHPGRGVDVVNFVVERLRHLRVEMLLIEGTDHIMRCRQDERAGMLDLFARITKASRIQIVGAGDSTSNGFAAAGVPFEVLRRAVVTPAASAVLECLTMIERGQDG